MTRQSRPGAGLRREYCFPRVERCVLSNGLRILVSPLPRLPLVSILALVDAGPTRDGTSEAGLASLTARALSEGTQRLDGAELTDQLEALGSGLDSGSAWDEAVASLTVTPVQLEMAVKLLGDILSTPRFSERDVIRLRAERLAELLQQQMEPRRARHRPI